MKILRIIASVNPLYGGPMEGIRQVSQQLIKMGHEVEVLCLDAPGAAHLVNYPVTVHAIGPGKGDYCYCANITIWLTQHAKFYDAIIISGVWQHLGFSSYRTLKPLGVPYYIFTHGMLDPWFKKQYPLKHLKKYLYWLVAEYWVLRNAKAVLFTSEEEKILARQSFWPYHCNEMIVNYGTSSSQGNSQQQKLVFLQAYPHLQNKKILLFLSRIHHKKGCDILIEAFGQIINTDDNLHLVIAGGDQIGWQKDLMKLANQLNIADRITWAGMLSGDIKWGAFYASEAFILPSHTENFGIVVAEALACSLPVLISNKVNIWREISQDGAGLVEEDTLEGTVQLLQKWLALPIEKQQEMRANARKCFLENFEIGKAALSLTKIIFDT